VTAAWFVLRAASATAILVFAAAKLARWPRSADVMWRPAIITDRAMRVGVGTVAVLEVTAANAVVFAPDPELTAVAVVLLGAALTSYGTAALRREKGCGCSGSTRRTATTLRLFWARNLVLFAAAALGVFFGPSSAALVHGREAEWLALTPAVLLVALMVIGGIGAPLREA
jgi:hypothetical protein